MSLPFLQAAAAYIPVLYRLWSSAAGTAWASTAGAVLGWARTLAVGFLSVFLAEPLRALYRQGPNVNGWGFWGGIHDADICAQLTSVPAAAWARDAAHVAECADLIDQRFHAFLVAVYALLYAWVAYSVTSYAWVRFAVIEPLARKVREEVAVALHELHDMHELELAHEHAMHHAHEHGEHEHMHSA